jgi:protein ImuA
VARGLSLVAGGAVSARSGPAETCAPAKAGAQARVSAQKPLLSQGRTGPLPSQGNWSLPAPSSPTLCELFAAHPRDGGWAGFLLAQIGSEKPLLWVQDHMAILESGRIHPPGLPSQNLIHVEARDAKDALWAMEEGVRCAGLSCVIGELWGDTRVLDFTATRRLAVASERSGVPCWLVRLAGTANLSGARMRWRIASVPSLLNPLDPRAPGLPAWDAELFRSRNSPTGRWSITREAGAFHLAAAPGDRTLGEEQRLSA